MTIEDSACDDLHDAVRLLIRAIAKTTISEMPQHRRERVVECVREARTSIELARRLIMQGHDDA